MKYIAIGLIIGLILGAAVYLCLYTVDASEFAVVTRIGKPVAIRTEPGLYLKMPRPVSIVNRIDRRLQLFETALIEYLTADKKNIILKTFVCWKIEDPLKFFEATKNKAEDAELKLDDVICSLVGSTLGDHEMHQIISTEPSDVVLDEISVQIKREADVRTRPYGMTIEHVGFSRLALPDDNARSVYRRMIAERSAIAGEYRAQGHQRASEIRAKADNEKSQIIADANKQAQIIRGEGDALAADIYSSAYGQSPEFFEFIRKLEVDEKVLSSQSTIILPDDSELFQVLKPSR